MSELQIFLHPVVVVNVTDQYTRSVVRQKEGARVYGCLVGRQQGRRVDVLYSFEILLDENQQVDSMFILQRGRQFYRTFEGMEVLGWYTTKQGTTEASESQDMAIHQQMESLTDLPQAETMGDTTQINFSESPLFFVLNTTPTDKQRDLPMKMYELSLAIVEGRPKSSFKSVGFTIQTSEIERIGVDHLANISRSGASLLQGHLSSVHSSIKMLHSRISILKNYLQSVKSGELQADPAVLREIMAICQQLPAIDSNEFKVEFLSEYNDALLLTYLAAMTKSSVATQEMLDKFNSTYDRHGGRHHRGMF